MKSRIKYSAALSAPLLLLWGAVIFVPYNTEVEYSPVVLSEEKQLLHSYLTSDDKWRMYTTLAEITPTLRKAIVYKEDQYFYYHFGVNPVSVCRAAINNMVFGKRTSGASTITMQVARLLHPAQRTYANKLLEVFRAMQLEWRYTKDEILQMYLNLVPYGSNIEGVKAASLIYFEKMPDHLSLAEITALAIIPNRPSSLRLGHNNAYIRDERNRWLTRFGQGQVFADNAIEDAKSEPLTARRHQLPGFAPHWARRIKKEFSNENIIHTSVALQNQLKVEAIVKQYVQQLYNRRIYNAAALVVDNETMQVKAYVGSADYHNPVDGGQVDGIQAVRSPGSTLKPMLYGMAIDQGLVTPKTIVTDVPVNFSGYQPQNYQENFNGKVTVEYALAHSLNIPAVKVLDQLHPGIFVEALARAGFQQVEKDKNHLGLSTVLGGCGATLEELVRLYAALAHHGSYAPLQFLHGDTLQSTSQVLSPSAAYMISEILTDVVRPDLPAQWKNAANLPKVAWKTGTSYGRRDAWSIGFNKKHTIGVWVGNFSGEGVQELTGAEIAAPLLFHIFNTIDRESSKDWFSMPKGVNFRYVCAESGRVPGENCTQQQLDYFLPGISDYQTCDHLRHVYVSADSSRSYCTTCLPPAGYVKALYPNHQPEMLDYFEQHQISYTHIPEHNPDCERLFTTSAPKITSPVDGLEYMVDKTDSLQLMLSSQTANNVNQVFWYINNRYYRSSPANESIYFTPDEGNVKISCTDDKGRNTDIFIEVKKVRF